MWTLAQHSNAPQLPSEAAWVLYTIVTCTQLHLPTVPSNKLLYKSAIMKACAVVYTSRVHQSDSCWAWERVYITAALDPCIILCCLNSHQTVPALCYWVLQAFKVLVVHIRQWSSARADNHNGSHWAWERVRVFVHWETPLKSCLHPAMEQCRPSHRAWERVRVCVHQGQDTCLLR